MQNKIKYTPQGFSYVDVNLLEVIAWGGIGICNSCGHGPFRHMKLIYVLGDTYCDKCFENFLERSKSMPKLDIEYDLNLQKGNTLIGIKDMVLFNLWKKKIK